MIPSNPAIAAFAVRGRTNPEQLAEARLSVPSAVALSSQPFQGSPECGERFRRRLQQVLAHRGIKLHAGCRSRQRHRRRWRIRQCVLDHRDDQTAFDARLGDDLVGARPPGLLHNPAEVGIGEYQHGKLGWIELRADQLEQLHAVDFRQQEVEQDKIHWSLVE